MPFSLDAYVKYIVSLRKLSVERDEEYGYLFLS